MKAIYFDCFSGICGSMILGALLDTGYPLSELEAGLRKLPLEGYALRAEKVQKGALAATLCTVQCEETGAHRDFALIRELIEGSALSPRIKERAIAVFAELARAEGAIHNRPPERVHFHEVGAIDSMVDIIGSILILEDLGIESFHASPVHTGRGFVESRHGTIPVPAPATLELLRPLDVYSRGIEHELVTPTGAAVLAVLAGKSEPLPAMQIEKIGYGAGTHELPIPNLLRIMIGRTTTSVSNDESDRVISLETNIDDMNPEFYEYVFESLLEAGALDVYAVPTLMKKNRPAVVLHVLTAEKELNDIIRILFRETTTLGLRLQEVERRLLARRSETAVTPFGPVKVKLSRRGEESWRAAPEYEDCRRLAREKRVPLQEVYAAALEAARGFRE